MESNEILILGAVAVGGYLLYQHMQSQAAAAPAAPATPGGTGNPLQGTSSQPGTFTGAGSPPPATKTLVSLINVTHPQSQFHVGDVFQLLVTGPPNSPVTGLGIHNGNVPPSPASFGSTDANGRLTIGGTMDASTVGTWQETWQVGGSAPATINFTVQS